MQPNNYLIITLLLRYYVHNQNTTKQLRNDNVIITLLLPWPKYNQNNYVIITLLLRCYLHNQNTTKQLSNY